MRQRYTMGKRNNSAMSHSNTCNKMAAPGACIFTYGFATKRSPNDIFFDTLHSSIAPALAYVSNSLRIDLLVV